MNPRGRRSQAGHQAGARRIAQGCLTVSILKNDTASSKFVNAGRLNLRMAIQTTDPVVLVVDRDKKNVRSLRRSGPLLRLNL